MLTWSQLAIAAKVGGLSTKWTPRIEAAKTPEEKAQLKQTANGELVQAIRSVCRSIDRDVPRTTG